MKKIVMLVLVVGTVSTSAFAAVENSVNIGNNSLNVSVGLTQPLNNAHVGSGVISDGSTGFFTQGQFLHSVGNGLSFGGELDYLGHGSSDESGIINTKVSGETIGLLAVGRFSTDKIGKVRPYAEVGMGLGLKHELAQATLSPGYVWAVTGTSESVSFVDQTKAGFAYALRVGADYEATERIAFGAKIGLFGMPSMDFDFTDKAKQLQSVYKSGSASEMDFNFGVTASYKF